MSTPSAFGVSSSESLHRCEKVAAGPPVSGRAYQTHGNGLYSRFCFFCFELWDLDQESFQTASRQHDAMKVKFNSKKSFPAQIGTFQRQLLLILTPPVSPFRPMTTAPIGVCVCKRVPLFLSSHLLISFWLLLAVTLDARTVFHTDTQNYLFSCFPVDVLLSISSLTRTQVSS